ncbi:hypothetical protein E1293_40365 [Actinomadura darangshiensis]|uniref:Uncharacterized protein n=1 Tax=Actinomadura darangshiensis TaxID=705336 RepID=A0A4R5A1T3_9ACTN|nr:hypothetical protein [Actinomadura darangshiensis]TDD65385.1 hypothetical protein E1293_40365 [Actinomadura darangshiensis]
MSSDPGPTSAPPPSDTPPHVTIDLGRQSQGCALAGVVMGVGLSLAMFVAAPVMAVTGAGIPAIIVVLGIGVLMTAGLVLVKRNWVHPARYLIIESAGLRCVTSRRAAVWEVGWNELAAVSVLYADLFLGPADPDFAARHPTLAWRRTQAGPPGHSFPLPPNVVKQVDHALREFAGPRHRQPMALPATVPPAAAPPPMAHQIWNILRWSSTPGSSLRRHMDLADPDVPLGSVRRPPEILISICLYVVFWLFDCGYELTAADSADEQVDSVLYVGIGTMVVAGLLALIWVGFPLALWGATLFGTRVGAALIAGLAAVTYMMHGALDNDALDAAVGTAREPDPLVTPGQIAAWGALLALLSAGILLGRPRVWTWAASRL